MQLQNAMYRVIHKRKNITVSFTEHPEFLKINEFYTYTLGEYIKAMHFHVQKSFVLKI